MIRLLTTLLFFIGPLPTSLAQPQWPESTITASEFKSVNLIVNHTHPRTFFCHVPFSLAGKVTIKPCEQCPKTEVPVAWLRIVPPRVYTAGLSCYNEKRCVDNKGRWYQGLRCCEQKSGRFRLMHRDLFNVVPALPALAKQRRQHTFMPEIGATTGCTFRVEPKQGHLYVTPHKLGFIARTYLYMDDTYDLGLTATARQRYQRWHQGYPPDHWELKRHALIQKAQGNINPWLLQALTHGNAIHHSKYPLHLESEITPAD